MKLWLDDFRPPPHAGWIWAKTAQQAIERLHSGEVSFASLDHDLDFSLGHNEKTGYDVVKWMVEHDVWPPDGIVVHSWNPPGAENMCKMIDRYGPYATRCRHIPDQRPWTDLGVRCNDGRSN